MNTREALKRIEAQKETLINLTGWAVYVYIEELIKSLDEPEKVKVPQFVADWVEECKAKKKSLLKSLLYTPEGVNSWVDNSENQEKFALAWIFGYEVEKEKRYLVRVKGVNGYGKYLNKASLSKEYFFASKNEVSGYRTKHTRKELEKANFGWVFDCPGIEIEEVK